MKVAQNQLGFISLVKQTKKYKFFMSCETHIALLSFGDCFVMLQFNSLIKIYQIVPTMV